jgi:hypothetical protein
VIEEKLRLMEEKLGMILETIWERYNRYGDVGMTGSERGKSLDPPTPPELLLIADCWIDPVASLIFGRKPFDLHQLSLPPDPPAARHHVPILIRVQLLFSVTVSC